MTKNEFIDYVSSFKKNPGEFTQDEIVSIGKAHKEINSQADRSWEWVKNIVGWDRSAESLRCFVNGRLNKANTTEETGEDPFRKNIENLYKEKTKIRDTYNAYRRTIRDEARIDDLKDIILEAADKFSKLPICEWKDTHYDDNDKKEAILLLSDLHIGVECDNYYNKYNTGIAFERCSKLLAETIKYCKKNNVETLHVINLGDMIHGIIHTNARLESQLDVGEQIIVAADLLSQFMNGVTAAAPKVTYHSVFDNHSRAVADKNEHIEKEQFSKVIDWFISQRLSATSIDFKENEVDGGVGKITLQNGKKVMFAHGHQDSINSSWQNFIGLTKEWIDYIMLAHYHNAKEKSYNGSVVFVNGSIVGTEQYAFGKRLFSDPTQKLIIFSPTDDSVIDINISLK